ncbi:uncharacterized protein PHALS_05036 [Plasmopara halstedii]|uniref:Uncharacterized protein n=1 Tax=Plasmopara halstedii TaxID=4781 RepID=A0A0N7L419_PLAHL|nr:uncharacterized protein PHALS_05036 [Plasmopara halstedii]CEG37443.1 hypothetical protein PHALS_05036 [Plasmopara halstedii]|eukprot:XP_024573812.1 hypothetical protein PHALS_05036 [Plasmopara halstedii]
MSEGRKQAEVPAAASVVLRRLESDQPLQKRNFKRSKNDLLSANSIVVLLISHTFF